MRYLILLILALLLIPPSNAIIISKRPEDRARRGDHERLPKARERMAQAGYTFFRVADHRTGKHHPDAYRRSFSTSEGIFSAICAAFSLISLAALALTSSQLFIIPAIGFAVAAVVFGCIGIKRVQPGYAIAGLLTGILAILGGIVALVLVQPL